jgi:NTP pyrophosphatase (non-canonical NTP hydrolase)
MPKLITPWHVVEDGRALRRLGKTLEELSELSAVVARVIIQGIDERDPSSRKLNRRRLEEELGDVLAQIELLCDHYKLNGGFIVARSEEKVQQMEQWEQLLEKESK